MQLIQQLSSDRLFLIKWEMFKSISHQNIDYFALPGDTSGYASQVNPFSVWMSDSHT